MKINKFLLTLRLTIIGTCATAQYVTIPDTNFATVLDTIVPTAMNGYQMDTTNAAVLSLTRIVCENKGIKNVFGVQYFKSLITLDCGTGSPSGDSNKITSLPPLPLTLDTLICGNNKIDSLPTLPPNLVLLYCYENRLKTLPALPNTIVTLYCYSNSINKLPALPDSLVDFNCANNWLDSMPALPNKLLFLSCNNNQLDSLPSLPPSLYSLVCDNNQIDSLPTLPDSLNDLLCGSNNLTKLPALPLTLGLLDCSVNQITGLPTLPNSLNTLYCYTNQLAGLPVLPAYLSFLNCASNPLIVLPALPSLLGQLYCSADQLTTLPAFPATLYAMDCSQNPLDTIMNLPNALSTLDCSADQLTSLPVMPASMGELTCSQNNFSNLLAFPNSIYSLDCESDQLTSLTTWPNAVYYLDCENSNISCMPVFPATLSDSNSFDISNNPFNCLPNYVLAMNKATLNLPLCALGNAHGCPSAKGIVGFTYYDLNGNCIKDTSDRAILNVAVRQYNGTGTFLNQTYTAINGVYDFPDSAGTYTVSIDTSGMPFIAQCMHPGLDSTMVLANIDTNVNFSLQCKPGIDVGVQSVCAEGLIFPGMQHNLNIVAGDMSQWFNLNCASGDSGTVQITIKGPVTFAAFGPGAITPSYVSGNVFTYHIADFGAIDNKTAFNMVLNTDVTAQQGDDICVTIAVTPAMDNNPSNNIYQYCYQVTNSHDPNLKTVYPGDVRPGYDGWFTYTIQFQNTGTAAAQNIVLTDTLNKNLDLSTFQVINYSSQNTVHLLGNVLSVSFTGIDLPDSISNPQGSIGFVQYRIKPKPKLPSGAFITNTAYIYFDYNAAVVTNTTYNVFNLVESVNTIVDSTTTSVYPNPNKGEFTVMLQNTTSKCNISVYNELGQEVNNVSLHVGSTQVSLNDKAAGIYLYRIVTDAGKLVSSGKIVVVQ